MNDADLEAVEARWRAACHAAGVALTDEDVARARATGGLADVAKREALIRGLHAWSELPDYLDTGALERSDDGR